MNKMALITGGSRGLGRAGALALAAEGCDVVITYHSNKEAADSLVKEVEWAGQQALAMQLNILHQTPHITKVFSCCAARIISSSG